MCHKHASVYSTHWDQLTHMTISKLIIIGSVKDKDKSILLKASPTSYIKIKHQYVVRQQCLRSLLPHEICRSYNMHTNNAKNITYKKLASWITVWAQTFTWTTQSWNFSILCNSHIIKKKSQQSDHMAMGSGNSYEFMGPISGTQWISD